MVDNITVEVEGDEYRDLAEHLRTFWEGRTRRYQEEYDQLTVSELHITVGGWQRGPCLDVEEVGNVVGEKVPSFDKKWTRAVLSAGYVPSGHICDDDGGNMTWYLRPVEDLDEAVEKAEEAWEKEKEFAEQDFEDYLKEHHIEDVNEVEHQGYSRYNILHDWFDTDEIVSMAGDDDIEVRGIDADSGYIAVLDQRQ